MVALNKFIFVPVMSLESQLFNIQSPGEFEKIALAIFKYQFENNRVYRSFCDLLYVHSSDVTSIDQIPFLPIQFFKTHKIGPQNQSIDTIFTSSGTSGAVTSKHYVADITIYEKSFRKGIHNFYQNIDDYAILALLPSYLERTGSSLIYMVNDLIKRSKHPKSGFYMNDYQTLASTLTELNSNGDKTLLIGVSFALLNLLETSSFNLSNTIIMETGGMKGRRKELIRSELHALLSQGFGVDKIHSEYGMTELLSQAYSKGDGIFKSPPWMQVFIRDTEDPLTLLPHQKTGGINVIDLANINSCAFIATQDLGKTYEDRSFEVLGRFDNSDLRGCNLMVY